MKMNNYLIATLTEPEWEGEIRGTLSDFLNESGFVLDPYPLVPEMLLFNDLRNLESIVRSESGSFPMTSGSVGTQELISFCEAPFQNAPDHFPEWLIDYFEKYRENKERADRIEEIYLSYFEFTKQHPYMRFFSSVVYAFRTVISAVRLLKEEKPLETMLKGEEEICRAVIEHRNSADLGLKALFPEIVLIQAAFEKGIVERERALDKLLIAILYSYSEDNLFGDHVIYNHIFSLLVRDRWCGHNEGEGAAVIDKLASA